MPSPATDRSSHTVPCSRGRPCRPLPWRQLCRRCRWQRMRGTPAILRRWPLPTRQTQSEGRRQWITSGLCVRVGHRKSKDGRMVRVREGGERRGSLWGRQEAGAPGRSRWTGQGKRGIRGRKASTCVGGMQGQHQPVQRGKEQLGKHLFPTVLCPCQWLIAPALQATGAAGFLCSTWGANAWPVLLMSMEGHHEIALTLYLLFSSHVSSGTCSFSNLPLLHKLHVLQAYMPPGVACVVQVA